MTRIMLKYYLSKSLRIPRRLRKIYNTRFNRLKSWLNDVKFGRNMQVFTKCYLTKAKDSRITIGDDCVITSGDAFNPLCRVQRAMIFAEPGATVVTKSIPADSIAGGNPCQVIKKSCIRR